MARNGSGNLLGVGGTRRTLGRNALRGNAKGGRIGGGTDPAAQKRELLRKLQEKQGEAKGHDSQEHDSSRETA
ncbi:DUF6243 family protein [Streptomyces sp. TRM68367]|uniref:DUF6243 family protein n=1 Tax=Streptomyces sp. TRM68367 TaxID=2758415 RepID=UPI00165AAFA6|nr:DUF6243 family protein [Streptomyces sp. TRM68367]MBC9726030.1 hypothetical protein [Streptomyces sp. TRM68367]